MVTASANGLSKYKASISEA